MKTNSETSCKIIDVPFKGFDVVAIEDEHGIHVLQDEQLVNIYLAHFGKNQIGVMLKRYSDDSKHQEYLNKKGEWVQFDFKNLTDNFDVPNQKE